MPAFSLSCCLAVVPIVAGPLQVLLALAPGVLLLLFSTLLACFRPRFLAQTARVAWRLKVPLTIFAVAMVGLLYGAQALLSQNGKRVAQAGSDWPTTRGDMARTGATPDTLSPSRGGLNWSWNRSGHAVYCSPAIAGNRAYITTAVADLTSDGRGEVVAVDLDTGQTAWRVSPPGFRATVSSPVIVGDYLLCGEGMHTVTDARVFCLDLRAGKEGGMVWSFRTQGHVESTPLVHQGRVYVGAGDDGLYCLAIEGDGQGSGRVLWHLTGKDFPDVESSPAIVEFDGRSVLYFGLGVDGNGICAVDAVTGKLLRRIKTPYPVFGVPAVAGGKLYVGMGNGDMVRLAEEIGLAPGGAVWGIDLARMNDPDAADPVDWKFPVERTVLGAVAVADDRLYFGSRNEQFYCLDLQGRVVKQWNARSRIVASPAVVKEFVYLVTNAGALYALDRDTLLPAWEAKVGAPGLYMGSPTIGQGQVLVGVEKGGLLSIGRADPTGQQIRLWPGYLAGPGVGGNPSGSPVSEFGAFSWQYPATAMGEDQATLVAAPPVAVDDDLYIASADARSPGLVRLPLAELTEETPDAKWGELTDGRFPTANPVWLSPAASGDLVLLVDGKPGDGRRYLHAVDAVSGVEAWKTVVATYASGQFCVTADEVLVQDSPSYLTCRELAERGRRRWTKSVGLVEHPPAVMPTLLAVAITEPPGLKVLDRVTGAVLATTALDALPVSSPVVVEEMVYVATENAVEARLLTDADLALQWSVPTGGSGDLVRQGEQLLCINLAGELLFLDLESGKATRRIAGFLSKSTPLPGRNAVLAAGKESLLRLPLETPTGDAAGKPTPWVDSSWVGPPAGPLVLHRGAVYQPRQGWGLVRWDAAP
ncbi:outer membrane protein assembly factor BamB family protein [Lignipirellula cremea]|uniref:Serine/threonine-protein kinase AfsK n=1 Tax=Lignipirellula cremea TaxID=2528010 RepID=A0A518DPT9_9BACT|nr:PQQ-binding-like beta-propeller repeat protein [Lignipirellula cremea]QDU93848.1 Serine/threonine-protein kinase AfsK [Lignipirellula cremea]